MSKVVKLVNKLFISILLSGATTLYYCMLSYNNCHSLDVTNQAFTLASACLSLSLNICLLFDVSTSSAGDLGRMESEKTSLVLGLFLTSVFLGLSIFQQFSPFFTEMKSDELCKLVIQRR